MTFDKIKVVGAKVHNLKNISIEIPKNKLVVITGPSGSGKSSLAFDTIYVEGQRRYIESLSSYARQFLGQFQPPDVESISGLSPSIAIDQKGTSRNPRSTVGTVTEIYDYMRVLFARVGTAHCPGCGRVVEKQSPHKIVQTIFEKYKDKKLQILSPIFNKKKGEHKEILGKFLSMGFARVRIDGVIQELDQTVKLDKNKQHTLDLLVDRVVVKESSKSRIVDSLEIALKHGGGTVSCLFDDENEVFFSEHQSCHHCNKSFPELEPRLFSFNSPVGACEKCNGLGESKEFSYEKVFFDESLPILDGALSSAVTKHSFLTSMIESILKEEKVDRKKTFKQLPAEIKSILINGSDRPYTYSFKSENSSFHFTKPFPGIFNWLEKRYVETESERKRQTLEEIMSIGPCNSCKGKRLKPFSLAVSIAQKSIYDISSMSITDAFSFFKGLELHKEKKIISEKLVKEIVDRLSFLLDVGLSYLTMTRSADTLSGGESQRIRLATQLGSALSGVLYVLDEPSIGLHQRDNAKLVKTLKGLRDIGNTVLVVEHDEETMREADYLIDMGPGAGVHGGEIVEKGTPNSFIEHGKGITARFLRKDDKINIDKSKLEIKSYAKLKGGTKNNIHNLDCEIPLDGLVLITGVSGSGKSTLVHDILVPGIRAHLNNETISRPPYRSLTGINNIQSLIELDQSPIGRTPSSNPATYSGLFDGIRTLFSLTNDAKTRGYKPGRFSFNVKGGRCEECEGDGVKKIEMHFLPDVYVTCSSCNGSRYNPETLSILYRGKNIADVLNMTLEEANSFFSAHPQLSKILQTFCNVGLGYMKLGQPATTLSGGEAQRLKLASELYKRPRGKCLYILDEPTTGLHFQDIKVLMMALNVLIQQGHCVWIIEHNLDVIKCADTIVDLGPEGGSNGGKIIEIGDPDKIMKNSHSFTGQFLKKHK